MRIRLQFAGWAALVVALTLGLGAQGRVIDQIAAVVDGQAVTQSQVEDAAWLSRFSAPGALDAAPLTGAETLAARGHVIDATVSLNAATAEGYNLASDQQVDEQWARIVAATPDATTRNARLRAAHLDETTVRNLLRQQLTVLNFLDDHVANSVVVDDAEVQKYYDDVFVPEARAQGLAVAALAAVRSRIHAILTQQQLAAAEQQYLDRLKADAKIDLRDIPAATARPGTGGRP